jgi:hypothetical protein
MSSSRQGKKLPRAAGAPGRAGLEAAFFALQQERNALTGAIMQLREGRIRPRGVLRVLVALWRLERANRRAAAVLGDAPDENAAVRR